jgi:formate hydrogenlyase subunit 4
MNQFVLWVVVLLVIAVLPPCTIGVIRKTKATLQARIGASIFQPLLDLAKLLMKGEVVSEHSSWMLRGAAAANVGLIILIALATPWIPGIPALLPMDIFLLVYLFVVLRFLTVLGALDTASPFGGFAASREVTLAVLVEPAVILCLAALAVVAHTTSLQDIFAFSSPVMQDKGGLWVMVACGLYLSSLVELSRMPADDPTTHLELTMVHEAMILENSGPNLALAEYANAVKLVVLFGLCGQCLLHAVPTFWSLRPELQAVCGLVSVVAMAGLTAVIEATFTKLRWTKLPDFIAYAVTFGLLSAAFAVGTLR